MTTTELAKLMYSGDDEAFEAAIETTGLVKVTRRMAKQIEAVASMAFETENYALESLCQLASNGAAPPARLLVAKAKRMGGGEGGAARPPAVPTRKHAVKLAPPIASPKTYARLSARGPVARLQCGHVTAVSVRRIPPQNSNATPPQHHDPTHEPLAPSDCGRPLLHHWTRAGG